MLKSRIAAGIAGTLLWAGSAFAQDTLKVGANLPMSGPNAELGEIFSRAASIAVKHINADKMLSKPLELAIEDSQATPQGGVVAMNKLVNVIKIVELDPAQSVQRELLLVKVRADAAVRSAVLEVTNLFRAKIVDVGTESVTIEATGTADKLAALLKVLEPYGIREMVQSGMVAVGRGPRSITGTALRALDRSA